MIHQFIFFYFNFSAYEKSKVQRLIPNTEDLSLKKKLLLVIIFTFVFYSGYGPGFHKPSLSICAHS